MSFDTRNSQNSQNNQNQRSNTNNSAKSNNAQANQANNAQARNMGWNASDYSTPKQDPTKIRPGETDPRRKENPNKKFPGHEKERTK